ncbi:hypothetical protein Moror_5366 [Moniliophthora roreri MCA 2997]|uniref:Uncharacterized protein n=1 Tax=Moniliophthora roreri (strain MCA 2997) TaxID=1381753 RepID=V2XQQ6_MONRO|nr:hypothetical protein Moror_5366 [Moniliophthora roreri MCA 2997]
MRALRGISGGLRKFDISSFFSSTTFIYLDRFYYLFVYFTNTLRRVCIQFIASRLAHFHHGEEVRFGRVINIGRHFGKCDTIHPDGSGSGPTRRDRQRVHLLPIQTKQIRRLHLYWTSVSACSLTTIYSPCCHLSDSRKGSM